MNATQHAAFQAGAGISANALLLGIASIVMVLIFVWALWVTFGTFRAWQDGNASLFDLAWGALRASIIVMVLGFYLR
jgi:integrating conjugative element protein (TIGR03758 family)